MSSFDREAAISTLGGERILQAIAQVYLTELPAHIQRLQSDLAGGDRDALADTAHFIKGGLQTLQARGAQTAAVALEQHCRTSADPAEPLVQALVVALESLAEDLRQFLA